jgi:hypothetical protein
MPFARARGSGMWRTTAQPHVQSRTPAASAGAGFALRVAAAQAAADMAQREDRRLNEIWQQAIASVLSALNSGQYATQKALTLPSFLPLMIEADELAVRWALREADLVVAAADGEPSNLATLARALESRFGAAWLSEYAFASRLLNTAIDVLHDHVAGVPPRRGFAAADATTAAEYNRAASTFQWAGLAAHVIAVDRLDVPKAVLEDVESDLSYASRDAWLASWKGAYHRTMEPFGWRPLIYELVAEGLDDHALVLLVEAVSACPNDSSAAGIASAIASIDVSKLKPVHIRGLLALSGRLAVRNTALDTALRAALDSAYQNS